MLDPKGAVAEGYERIWQRYERAVLDEENDRLALLEQALAYRRLPVLDLDHVPAAGHRR